MGKEKKDSKEKEARKKKPLIQKITSILRRRIKQQKTMRPKDEFRYNHDTEHMTHVFQGNAEEYRAVGFTTKETTFGKRNMPLKQNPKKNDTRPSYVRNGIVSDSKGSYSKKKAKNYKLSSEDRANVKSKERNYKTEQKRRKKAQKK